MTTREIHLTSPRQGIGGSKAESLRGMYLRGMYPCADPVQGGQEGVSERAQPGFKTCKPWVRPDSVSSRQPLWGGTLTSPSLNFSMLEITEVPPRLEAVEARRELQGPASGPISGFVLQ